MQVVSDVELIEPTEDNKELIDKIKQEQKEKLKDINYIIDLNTGDVKQNNHTALIVGNIYPKDNTPTELHDKLYDYYLDSIQEYKKDIQKYKKKSIKTIATLQKTIYEFNKMFDRDYYNGFNLRVKDLLNDQIKSAYIEQRARAYTYIQYNSIKEYDIKAFIECNIQDLIDSDTHTTLLNASDLTTIQEILQDKYKKVKDMDILDSTLYNSIYDIILDLMTQDIKREIQDNSKFYDKVHHLYKDINQDIKDILDRFNTIAIEFNSNTDAMDIQQPSIKKLPLLLPKIFDNTYLDKKYATIYTTEQLKLQIRLDLDIKASDFRENIIFYDSLTNKKIDLLPIDYAIFIACTELNATNKSLSGIRGNIPITIDSIVQYIADNDKLYNTKKRQKKLYDYIKDRLLLYKSCIVDAIYTKNGEINKLYKDPIAILQNTLYNDPVKNTEGYIIGASAILTIIAQIEIIEGKPYLASYTKAREYINDSQNNTIEILNTKYYILPKVLQMINTKSKGEVYKPIISLEDMYKSIALLKGKDTLNRTEQKRVRDSALMFLQHLKSKGILQAYDTKPLPKDTNKSDKQPIIKANQKIEHLYIRPNYKAKI